MPRCFARAAESYGRVAAGEVVDATVSFGLAEDCDDFARRDRPLVDQPQDRRDVTRIAHRHAVDNAFQLPAPCLAVSGNDHGCTDNGGSFNTIDAPGAVATELLFDNEADFLVRFIPLP